MDIMEDERTGGIERQDRRQTATAELGQAPSTGLSVNLCAWYGSHILKSIKGTTI